MIHWSDFWAVPDPRQKYPIGGEAVEVFPQSIMPLCFWHGTNCPQRAPRPFHQHGVWPSSILPFLLPRDITVRYPSNFSLPMQKSKILMSTAWKAPDTDELQTLIYIWECSRIKQFPGKKYPWSKMEYSYCSRIFFSAHHAHMFCHDWKFLIFWQCELVMWPLCITNVLWNSTVMPQKRRVTKVCSWSDIQSNNVST